MVYTLRFFSSKCSLFHNSNVFGSCIIHILYIYSTTIGTEYFKHGIYSQFFPLQKSSLFHNSNVLVPVLFIFYIQGVLKIKNIYSTNIDTEYFKHGIYSPFFHLQNAVCFIILTYLVPVVFIFYIQGVLKLKHIYSTNIGTEYLKHGIYSHFFHLQIAVCFIILTYLFPVLFTFYI